MNISKSFDDDEDGSIHLQGEEKMAKKKTKYLEKNMSLKYQKS